MSGIFTKVTSVESSSGAPTVPNPTPRTDAHERIDSPPDMNLDAVGNILGPVQEQLNDSAEAASYPSPPINTPAFSPAPSVYKARGRGLSAVGDRLAQLKLEERKDSDVKSSNRSGGVPSIPEAEGEEEEDAASDNGKYAPANDQILLNSSPIGSIPAMLGSPHENPRLQEYLTFNSGDLPVTDVAAAGSSSSTLAAVEGSHSRDQSIKSGVTEVVKSGVTEKSNWANEVEDFAERALLRLEQLAADEVIQDPTKSMEDYYVERLERLLNDSKRRVKVNVSRA